MATKIPDNYAYNSQKPNFERDKVDLLENLRSDRALVSYDEGHIVYCEETKEHYKFMGNSVDFDESTGFFRMLFPDGMATKIETMWNELFPITASIKLYNAKTGTELTDSYPTNKPFDIKVKFSITENNIALDDSNISNIKLSYDGKIINIPIGTNEYTVTNISDTTTFTITYILIDGSVKTDFETVSFYAPSVSVNLKLYKAGTNSSISGYYEKGIPVNVEARISITEGGLTPANSRISSINLKYNSKNINIPVGTTKWVVEDDIANTTTFTVTYTMVDGNTYKASQTMSFTYGSYYGVVDKDVIASEITTNMLNKRLLSSKNFTISFKLNNQKCCYLYPSSYGALTSIKDDKNYELLYSFVKETIILNGVNYYAYILEHAVTVEEDYKLTFS